MTSFSTLVQNELIKKKINVITLYERLNGSISRASLYRFVNGETIPSLSKANAILNILDLNIPTEELVEILDLSIPEFRKNDKLHITSYVDHSLIFDSLFLTKEEAGELIKKRAVLVAGNLSNYLTLLIKNDIKNHTLGEGNNE